MMTYVFKVIKAFEDLEEGDLVEIQLPISEYDRFKAVHPELERYFDTAPAFKFVDMKVPDGRFMDRLDKIRRTYPGAKGMLDGARWQPKREW